MGHEPQLLPVESIVLKCDKEWLEQLQKLDGKIVLELKRYLKPLHEQFPEVEAFLELMADPRYQQHVLQVLPF